MKKSFFFLLTTSQQLLRDRCRCVEVPLLLKSISKIFKQEEFERSKKEKEEKKLQQQNKVDIYVHMFINRKVFQRVIGRKMKRKLLVCVNNLKSESFFFAIPL